MKILFCEQNKSVTDLFFTDEFRVLEIIYNESYEGVYFNGQEHIAKMLGLSRATVNKTFGRLKAEAFIEQTLPRKWAITKKGQDLFMAICDFNKTVSKL